MSRADHVLIHAFAAVAAGVGAGLPAAPSVGSATLTQLQATMVVAIAEHYGVPLQRTAAAELVLTLGASMLGRRLADLLGPNPLVRAATAAAFTEAVGWAAVRWLQDRA